MTGQEKKCDVFMQWLFNKGDSMDRVDYTLLHVYHILKRDL